MLDDGRDCQDTQIATYQYGKLTMLFEGALWTPYYEENAAADRHLKRTYRKPWVVPDVV